MQDKYNRSYYNFNNQSADRIGNLFYKNIIKKNFKFKTYLDFGCGVGFLLRRIENIKGVDKTYGFEINNFAISKSTINTKKSKIYDDFKKIDQKFDLISMLHVVEHIDDKNLSNLLKKIKDKLNTNGKILISTPAKNGLAHKIKRNQWIAFKDPTHTNLKNYEEWITYFKQQNLKIISSFSDGLWDFPYGGIINYLKYIKIYFFMLIQIFLGIQLIHYNEGETFIFILKNND